MVVIFKDFFPFSRMTKNDTNDQKSTTTSSENAKHSQNTYFEISNGFSQ